MAADPMKDRDRTKLLCGPSHAPRLRRGDRPPLATGPPCYTRPGRGTLDA
jgi:hypothetical protein